MKEEEHLKNIPFKDLERIGVLAIPELDTTTIYSDKGNMPIVEEWVDVHGNIDKYFMYKVKEQALKEFFDKKISHLDLIKKALNSSAVFFDRDNDVETIFNIKLVNIFSIPDEYLPDSDVDFSSDIYLSNDVEAIKKYFSL